jgi:hypothetical protein
MKFATDEGSPPMNPTHFTRFNHLTTTELDALVEQLAARSRELYREYKSARNNGTGGKRALKAFERMSWETHVAFMAFSARPDHGMPSMFGPNA